MYNHEFQHRNIPKTISIQIHSNAIIGNFGYFQNPFQIQFIYLKINRIIILVQNQFISIKIYFYSNMEFFIPILSKSFLMILHKLLLFLIILSRPVQSISNNGHRTALTATFFEFDLDIIPNPTVRFLISNILQKALFDTNPTVPVLGESDGRISRNVRLK